MNPFSTRERHTWRATARPLIAAVIQRVGRSDMTVLRAALRDAYPFGERANWPYKVWCDEVREQLGIKRAAKRARQEQRDSRQRHLFVE